MLRPHGVTLIPSIVITIILSLIPIALQGVVSAFNLNTSFLTAGQGFLATIFWYLLVFAYIFYRFLFWYFDIFILTNERVVDFSFGGILNKEIYYAPLGHIEDIAPKTQGFFGTIFNYGNVLIQTAGELPEFNFHNVPNPDYVAEKIMEQARIEDDESGRVR